MDLGNSLWPKAAPPGLEKLVAPMLIDINAYSQEENMSEELHREYLDKQNFVLRELTYYTYDFSEGELKQIVRYGNWFQALMEGKVPTDNPARWHFVFVCKGRTEPTTEYEKLWVRYLSIVAKDDERSLQEMRKRYAHESIDETLQRILEGAASARDERPSRQHYGHYEHRGQDDKTKKSVDRDVKEILSGPIYNWKEKCKICDGDGLNGRCWNCDGSGIIKH